MNAASPLDLHFRTRAVLEVSDFEDAALNALLSETVANVEPEYPIYRREQVAARLGPNQLLDRLAKRSGRHVQRPDAATLIAQMPDAIAMIFYAVIEWDREF